MYRSKKNYTSRDWRLYRAAYDEASRQRSERGEVGDHISDDSFAQKFVNRVNPLRSEFGFDD